MASAKDMLETVILVEVVLVVVGGVGWGELREAVGS
jgi:hypothetical protein